MVQHHHAAVSPDYMCASILLVSHACGDAEVKNEVGIYENTLAALPPVLSLQASECCHFVLKHFQAFLVCKSASQQNPEMTDRSINTVLSTDRDNRKCQARQRRPTK